VDLSDTLAHGKILFPSTRQHIIEMRATASYVGVQEDSDPAAADRFRAVLARSEYDSPKIAAAGVVRVPRKRRTVLHMQPLLPATRPTEVACMDFKRSVECGNGGRRDTFTVTDVFNRFVLYVTRLTTFCSTTSRELLECNPGSQ
jgi:hypothetical protein